MRRATAARSGWATQPSTAENPERSTERQARRPEAIGCGRTPRAEAVRLGKVSRGVETESPNPSCKTGAATCGREAQSKSETRLNEIKVTAFRWVPPFVQGFVRDLRVRWALEEVGLPYGERLFSAPEHASTDYRALQPFGQVPAYEEDGLVMFESGAIVLHIAELSAVLMPADAAGRAGVQAWMFAALKSIEPRLTMLNVIDFQPGGVQEGEKALSKRVVEHIDLRLSALAVALGDHPYLVTGRFSAADLLMATVLRTLDAPDRLTPRPILDAYLARCLSRPAYQKALAAQMASFAANAPG